MEHLNSAIEKLGLRDWNEILRWLDQVVPEQIESYARQEFGARLKPEEAQALMRDWAMRKRLEPHNG